MNTKLFNKLYLNVGAMKAGTTWLYRQLEQHPDIIFSPEKELHYLSYRDGNQRILNQDYKRKRFENALLRFKGDKTASDYQQLMQWYESYLDTLMDDNWYRQRFPTQLASTQYCADFSNLSCLITQATWQAILAMANEVKVSYVLRNPYERMWSHFKFHYQMQQRSIGNVHELTEADFITFDKASRLLLHSSYSQPIMTMQNYLPSESIKLINYDDIQLRPNALLSSIEDFLGIAHHNYLPEKIKRKINATESLPIPESFYKVFSNAVIEELDALGSLGFEVPKSWFYQSL